MGRRRKLLPSLTAFAVLLASTACHKDKAHSREAAPVEILPELRMQGMTVQNWGVDGLEWEMHSPVGEGFTTKNFVQVSNMSVQLYQGGQKSTMLTADHALMATGNPGKNDPPLEPMSGVVLSSGDMFLNGNVVVVSTDGSRLQTDWVRYSVQDRIIRSSAPVSVEREDSITTGKGLEATADLSRMKIFNQKLIIHDKKKP